MYCLSPDCDSCNPQEFCEHHDTYYRGYCEECREEEGMLDEKVIHDFDPSGDEHDPACMCPCCDLAEGRM